MKVSVDIVYLKIDSLAIQAYDNKLNIFVPNKVSIFEVIYLVATLLNQDAKQQLRVKGKEQSVLITSEAVDISKIDEVLIKVEPHSDYISAYGLDEIIDMAKSVFLFEPAEHLDFKLGEIK